MSIVTRTAVVGGLSLTLALGAAGVASANVHATAVAKPKQREVVLWDRVNRPPHSRTFPREGRPLLAKSGVGKNISLKPISVQLPMKVQLFTRSSKGKAVALGPVILLKGKDKGKSFKLNKKTVKPGTRFYLLLKAGSADQGSILKATVYF